MLLPPLHGAAFEHPARCCCVHSRYREGSFPAFFGAVFILLCTLASLVFLLHSCPTFPVVCPPDLSAGSERRVATLTSSSDTWSCNTCALPTELRYILLLGVISAYKLLVIICCFLRTGLSKYYKCHLINILTSQHSRYYRLKSHLRYCIICGMVSHGVFLKTEKPSMKSCVYIRI